MSNTDSTIPPTPPSSTQTPSSASGATSGTLPSNIQEAEKQLQQTIYLLGRSRYDRLLAESKESYMVDQCAKLAQHVNDLRNKATAELKSTIASSKPALSLVPDAVTATTAATPQP